MKEIEQYIISKLVSKYNIKKDEAMIFYIDMLGRRKIEHLLQNIDKHSTFESLKQYYYGGKIYEL